MIISELKLYDYRKFHAENGEAGLSITFHKGLNALIGENDSGKTAVIDALKLVLLTQSNDYVRPAEEDFYCDSNNEYVDEFRIECVISEFDHNEAKNFIEFLEFSRDVDGLHYSMHLFYRAWKEKTRIFTDLRVGDPDEGITLDNRARELLKAVYLRPLRDAEREMHSGRNSRLSQILMSHRVFQDRENHTLIQILNKANQDIETYFTQQEGQQVLHIIRDNLTEFHDKTHRGDASITATDVQLKAILESLSLNAPEIHPGLGELNLVFIAAELLLLKQDDIGGLKLALIEELEAHLHPQAQLRLISYLQNEYDKSGAQIIISTHSTILASKINLKNLVLLKGGRGYDLSEGNTGLEKGDYLFLQRFLDATKANLFFAKGIIMVEGDAENILIPVIAEILGYPLEKCGVSVVNVGSTAFLRYSRIFIRGDKEHTIDVPVSVITDCDVQSWEEDLDEDGHKIKVFCDKSEDSEKAVVAKATKYNVGSIQSFISPRWTLEYCIALSFLKDEFHRAINYGKKIKNSDKYSLTIDKIGEADKETENQKAKWAECNEAERAYKIYNLMLDGSGKSGLKSIVSQCLSSMLQLSIVAEPVDQIKMFDLDLYQHTVDGVKRNELKHKFEKDPYLKYIVDAIKHAVGADNETAQMEGNSSVSN